MSPGGERGMLMKLVPVLTGVLLMGGAAAACAQQNYASDTFTTSLGELEITFIGHGTLMFRLDELIIHIDPVSAEGDYTVMPKADLILVTHEHSDHLDPRAIGQITKDGTRIICSASCADRATGGIVMANGDSRVEYGIGIEAVPAYNIVHLRSGNNPYHPKGIGNGYLFTFGDTRVYVAGDTEDTPEMKALTGIDIAFLPMNLPYTMTPAMVADAARAFRPRILYPYHYGNTDTQELVDLLAGSGIEVRIRDLK